MSSQTKTETCCNSGCNKCEPCNSGCQSCQKTCETICESSQLVSSVDSIGSFSFSSCVNSGETIKLTASDWNSLIAYITSAYNYGDKGKISTPTMTKAESGQLIYKTTYNQIASALNLGSSDFSSLPNNEAHPVIYGKYFNDIEAYTKIKFKFKPTQCFDCNKCEECNSGCQGCDSGCYRCNSKDHTYTTTCEDKPSGT